jgi:hypothetical protein
MRVTDTVPAKLRASGSFLEALKQRPQEIVALLEVAHDGYVPAGLCVRSSFTARRFSAAIPAGGIDALLRDDRVLTIQPSSKLQPLSPP